MGIPIPIPTDFAPAHRAVRDADPRVEQAQVIVNLRHGAHGGAGILGRGFLVNGNRRGETFNIIQIRLFHLAEKLTRVGGEGLHIPSLALRVNGVERQRGLSGAGKSCKYNQLVAGNMDVDVFQVMLPRAFDKNIL